MFSREHAPFWLATKNVIFSDEDKYEVWSCQNGFEVPINTFENCGVSSDLDGYRGALKREVIFHTFLCVLV